MYPNLGPDYLVFYQDINRDLKFIRCLKGFWLLKGTPVLCTYLINEETLFMS